MPDIMIHSTHGPAPFLRPQPPAVRTQTSLNDRYKGLPHSWTAMRNYPSASGNDCIDNFVADLIGVIRDTLEELPSEKEKTVRNMLKSRLTADDSAVIAKTRKTLQDHNASFSVGTLYQWTLVEGFRPRRAKLQEFLQAIFPDDEQSREDCMLLFGYKNFDSGKLEGKDAVDARKEKFRHLLAEHNIKNNAALAKLTYGIADQTLSNLSRNVSIAPQTLRRLSIVLCKDEAQLNDLYGMFGYAVLEHDCGDRIVRMCVEKNYFWQIYQSDPRNVKRFWETLRHVLNFLDKKGTLFQAPRLLATGGKPPVLASLFKVGEKKVDVNICSQKLKGCRKEKGLTQKQLSELSGVSLPMIRAYEQGAADFRKKKEHLEMISAALGCDETYLLSP